MSSRSIFALRVVRCPSCHARLPVRGQEPMVVCEYCDARVELVRRRQSPKPAPREPEREPERPRHQASPHASPFATLLMLLPVFLAVASAAWWLYAHGPELYALLELPPPPPPTPNDSSRSAPLPPAAMEAAEKHRAPAKTPSGEIVLEDDVAPPGSIDEGESAKKRRRPKPAAVPSGPVLSVADAKAQLEPKVLECMRSAKTHSIRAYMGNKTVGPVSLLSDSRTRVDGVRAKLIGTTLGRCIDRAGASIRTRAFKSNYVRLELRNERVPDPLASLPVKPDRDGIAKAIEVHDPKVKACAAEHGEEGLREVFYFTIDGPTGKAMSVRGSYGSRAFRRCAEPIYAKIAFDRVQQSEVKYTHHVQL